MTDNKQELLTIRRGAIRKSVDKIRKLLSEIDVNIGGLSDEQELQVAHESAQALDAEISNLTELVKGLHA